MSLASCVSGFPSVCVCIVSMYMFLCVHVCPHACCIYVSVCLCVCLHKCACLYCVHVCLRLHMGVHVSVYVCVSVPMRVFIFLCVSLCVYLCVMEAAVPVHTLPPASRWTHVTFAGLWLRVRVSVILRGNTTCQLPPLLMLAVAPLLQLAKPDLEALRGE